MHKENWDDIRYVLAVADTGSVSAASRELGVNHATVLRRVAAFEERHGGPIFDRSASGYRVAAERARVIEAARAVESAVFAVDRAIEGAQAPLSGIVKVTSTDSLCHTILPRFAVDLRRTASDLKIELISSNFRLDLSRLDADITVRPSLALPDNLVGEAPVKLGLAVYAAPTAQDGWLNMRGPLSASPAARWMEENVPATDIVGAADSFPTLRELSAGGLGRVILPCLLGDSDPRLKRLDYDLGEFAIDIWVASHPDLAEVPRIVAVREFLVARLTRYRSAFLGVR